MFRLPQVRCVLVLLSWFASVASAQNATHGVVGRVSVAGGNPLQLRIEYRGRVTPQVQMLSSPDRLVIDLPNLIPGPSLHAIAVHRAEVLRVRTSLLSSKPAVTRVVVDLNAPEWYRVAPDGSGLLVTVGAESSEVDKQATIGWVSNNIQSPAHSATKVAVKSQAVKPSNGVTVQFDGGLMTIHAQNATLSEILFQIQKTTGAEIAIPAGSEQDHVAADFGPGTPREVMAELLNGTGLNFVVVGSEADPNALRSVILSRKAEGPDLPPGFAQQASAAPPAQNSEAEDEPIPDAPPQEDGVQPPQPNPNIPPVLPQAGPPPTDAPPGN